MARGGAGEGALPEVHVCAGRARRSGIRWGPFAGEGVGAVEGVRGGRSLGSAGAGSLGTGSVHRRGARSRAHRKARRLRGCRPEAARSSVRDGASVGTRAWTRSLRGGASGGAMHDATGACGGSPGRGPEARSVEAKASAGALVQASRSWVYVRPGSR